MSDIPCRDTAKIVNFLRYRTATDYRQAYPQESDIPHAHLIHSAALGRLYRENPGRIRITDFDPEAFAAWAQKEGRPADAAARTIWAGIQGAAKILANEPEILPKDQPLRVVKVLPPTDLLETILNLVPAGGHASISSIPHETRDQILEEAEDPDDTAEALLKASHFHGLVVAFEQDGRLHQVVSDQEQVEAEGVQNLLNSQEAVRKRVLEGLSRAALLGTDGSFLQATVFSGDEAQTFAADLYAVAYYAQPEDLPDRLTVRVEWLAVDEDEDEDFPEAWDEDDWDDEDDDEEDEEDEDEDEDTEDPTPARRILSAEEIGKALVERQRRLSPKGKGQRGLTPAQAFAGYTRCEVCGASLFPDKNRIQVATVEDFIQLVNQALEAHQENCPAAR